MLAKGCAAVDSGLAALLGAIIGGGLTAASSFAIESMRQRRAGQVDGRRAVRELRSAARLVADELAHSLSIIGMAAKDDTWGQNDADDLRHECWIAQQQTLADHLPTECWFAVTGAYELLDLLKRDGFRSGMYEQSAAILRQGVGALNAYAKRDELGKLSADTPSEN